MNIDKPEKLKVMFKITKLIQALILKLCTAFGHKYFLFLFERFWI